MVSIYIEPIETLKKWRQHIEGALTYKVSGLWPNCKVCKWLCNELSGCYALPAGYRNTDG